jgi:hypothetical protein
MKSEALKQLEMLSAQTSRCKHPNVPEHCRVMPKFQTTTANGLTKAVITWLELSGHKAWRQASEGKYRPGKQYTDVIGRTRLMKGSYRPGANKGHGDIASIINGVFVSWEIKIGKDRQSVHQKAFQDEVQRAGGKYFIVSTFDEFMQHYRNLINQ